MRAVVREFYGLQVFDTHNVKLASYRCLAIRLGHADTQGAVGVELVWLAFRLRA